MNPLLYGLPVAAYLYGAVPFGFLAAKLIKGVDIRKVGSGNIGATNAARVLGFRFFPIVFLLDVSKGLLPTLIAQHNAAQGRYDPSPFVIACGVAAILGHIFPIYLGFRGGKAVATSAGVFLVLAPGAALICGGIWTIVFAVWRYVSLASIAAAFTLPAAIWLSNRDPLGSGAFLFGFTALAAASVIALHRSNIGRLLSGTEHKVGSPRPPTGNGGH